MKFLEENWFIIVLLVIAYELYAYGVPGNKGSNS